MATNRRTDIFDCGIWDSFEKRRATHHHPGSAKPALQRIMLDECSLNRMQCVAMGKSLDRRDRARADINGKHHAGADSHALDPNGARRASAPVTAHLGSRHTQVYAQGLCQRGARLNLEGVLFSIQIQRNRDGTRTRFREGGLFSPAPLRKPRRVMAPRPESSGFSLDCSSQEEESGLLRSDMIFP